MGKLRRKPDAAFESQDALAASKLSLIEGDRGRRGRQTKSTPGDAAAAISSFMSAPMRTRITGRPAKAALNCKVPDRDVNTFTTGGYARGTQTREMMRKIDGDGAVSHDGFIAKRDQGVRHDGQVPHRIAGSTRVPRPVTATNRRLATAGAAGAPVAADYAGGWHCRLKPERAARSFAKQPTPRWRYGNGELSPIRIRRVGVPTPLQGVTVTRNQGCGNDAEVLTDDARLRPEGEGCVTGPNDQSRVPASGHRSQRIPCVASDHAAVGR